MKRLYMIMALALIAVVAAACGGGDDGGSADSPEAAGRQFFEAVISLNVDDARNLVCDARRDAIPDATDEDRATIGAVEFDLSDLEFTVSDQTDDTANITLGGVIKISAEGQELEMPVSQMFGEDLTVPAIREDGNWVLCPSEDSSILGSGG